MALPIFQSFYPTVAKWFNSSWRDTFKVIVDGTTGAPIGLLSQNANGPQGIWAPTPVSSAQIVSPSAAMIADLNATYQLNQAPYSRYYSDGTQLVPLSGEAGTVVPPGIKVQWISQLTITEGNPLTIEGGVVLVSGV